MASLQIYSSFEYGDESAIRSFFLENGLRHQQYAERISSQLGLTLPFFDVYDTMMVDEVVSMMKKNQDERSSPKSLQNWLLNHASLHDAEIKALTNQQDFDLYDVDFKDANSFFDWLNIHASLHDYVDQALGI